MARIVPEGPPKLEEVRQAVLEPNQLRQAIGGRTKGRASFSNAEVRSAIEAGRR